MAATFGNCGSTILFPQCPFSAPAAQSRFTVLDLTPFDSGPTCMPRGTRSKRKDHPPKAIRRLGWRLAPSRRTADAATAQWPHQCVILVAGEFVVSPSAYPAPTVTSTLPAPLRQCGWKATLDPRLVDHARIFGSSILSFGQSPTGHHAARSG